MGPTGEACGAHKSWVCETAMQCIGEQLPLQVNQEPNKPDKKKSEK